MPLTTEIVVEADAWNVIPDLDRITREAVALCLGELRARIGPDAELSVLLCDDARIRALNRDFRGLDKATNVLSFPAAASPTPALGDIAVAYETVAREARAEGKSLADHYTHMIVHGVLHILGHDHEAENEAEVMEALERSILQRLGIADPYRSHDEDIRPS